MFGIRKETVSNMGKIINKEHVERLSQMINENHGGKIHGGRINFEERIVEPTLVYKPSFESRLMNEEIFGPVLPI